ncbi:MAG: S8 family peptidase [Planctomycetota bacterium]
MLVSAAALTWAASLPCQDQLEVKSTISGFANEPMPVAERFDDRVVVKFKVAYATPTLDAALDLVGLRRLATGYGNAFEVIAVPAGTVDAVVAWLSRQSIVEYAEPDYVAHTMGQMVEALPCEDELAPLPLVPNDTFFSPYQWNFFDQGMVSGSAVSNYGVNAVTAWNTSSGANVTVAVVDTGVAYESFGSFTQAPDLAGATFVSPWNFVSNTAHANDDNGHGTHVAGTVRQSTNNGMGTAGLAYNCRIMPVKVLNSAGSGSYTAIANGIRWAADHGANVVSMSLGGTSGSTTLSSAVSYAWNAGCVLCAASGNTGRNGVNYPARYTQCIAVGATRFDGAKAGYSTYGSGLDVVAPGGDTAVDQNGDGYGDGILQQTFASGSPTSFSYYFFQGTSMATPHVAAIAALVKANKPAYSNAQVRSAIETSCRDLGSSGYDTRFGYGLVNAAAALTR